MHFQCTQPHFKTIISQFKLFWGIYQLHCTSEKNKEQIIAYVFDFLPEKERASPKNRNRSRNRKKLG